MKKFVTVLILIALVLTATVVFTGCDSGTNTESSTPDLSNRLELIDSCNLRGDTIVYIYYDTESMVMYQFVDGYKAGGLSVMYNADGTVMLYQPTK